MVVNLLIIRQLTFAQSITIVPSNPASPNKGTIDYNNATNQLQYWNSTAWIPITNAASGTGWTLSGNHISNNNPGNVGIGTNTPAAPLTIFGTGFSNSLYQTPNTGSLTSDGLLMGIENNSSTAFLLNQENAPLWLGTNHKIVITIAPEENVGIGTLIPLAGLHVENKSVLFNGLNNFFGITVSPPPVSGKGTRTFWYADKAAFRTGGVYNYEIFGFPDADVSNFNNWDKDSIGVFSFGAGFNTKAKGDFSVAMGQHSFAIGATSIALGQDNVAKGNFSFTVGSNNIASGESSIALGNGTKAQGDYAFASGFSTISSGNMSTAFGANTEASGVFSTAFGYSTTASGKNSTAMGKDANTNNHINSFCLAGIGSNVITNNSADNQLMTRFDNYTFMLGNTGNYVYLLPASNGWTYVSDRNKKENFEELNGESVLKKISKIPFYSWNFKDKEVKQYRHYGIMAQDFHDNFGKDKLGVIGNDTTISALDLLGVAYAGIKALEKRTEELSIKNEELRIRNENLVAQIESQNQLFSNEIAELRTIIQPKRRKIALIKKEVSEE